EAEVSGVAKAALKIDARKRWNWQGWINSPWILLLAPLAAVLIWLANNPQLIIDNMNQPYALLAGPALVGSVLAGWFILTFFKGIAAFCRKTGQAFLGWRKTDGSTFWMVISIFLLVSVAESGSYFNGLLGSNDL